MQLLTESSNLQRRNGRLQGVIARIKKANRMFVELYSLLKNNNTRIVMNTKKHL